MKLFEFSEEPNHMAYLFSSNDILYSPLAFIVAFNMAVN